MHTLYINIKKLRIEKGMSQDTLAKLTGYNDRSSITKIEKGLVDLQQSKISLFAKAFGISEHELVGWDDTNNVESSKIMKYYTKLNITGKIEAEKRVEELTYIAKYTEKSASDLKMPVSNTNTLNAAHADDYDSAPESMKQLEEDIMDDENF